MLSNKSAAVLSAFADDKPDWCPRKAERVADIIFQVPLIREVEKLRGIDKKDEGQQRRL